MTDLPAAREIRRKGEGGVPSDHVTLGYDERFLRRKRLVSAAGVAFLADLAETVSLDHGDMFVLEDGRLIGIAAAEEPLIEIRGDLARLAWHIGNRHTPCQIGGDRLLIRRDPVLADMLARLGAQTAEIVGPFTPEGGAYGHGRTMGHDHGPGGGHSHDPSDAHSHDHDHDHHHHHHGHVHHHISSGTVEAEDGEDEPEVIR